MKARYAQLRLFCLLTIASSAVWSGLGAEEEWLKEASWIWSEEQGTLCHLRRDFVFSTPGGTVSLLITADNGYEVYINGSFVGSDIGAESSVWQGVERFEIGPLIKAGTNVIAIRAIDLGGAAGVLAGLYWDTQGGEKGLIVTDATWRVTSSTDPTGFAEVSFREDKSWAGAKVIGKNGCAPWGMVNSPGQASSNRVNPNHTDGFKEPGKTFDFPPAILVVRGRIQESSTQGSPQAVWRIGNSRAYLELDTLGPSMPGRSLNLLRYSVLDGGYVEKVIYQREGGLVGSPSLTYDGKTIFFSCVPPGEKFWRICKLSIEGGEWECITSGPFHDFDPEPLPDGRIVFSSTRIGNREEYHGNLARALFVMNGDGSGLRAITHHIVGDMEPKVTAAGNIVFIRQDNFMERAKVETHIHSVRTDGTAGQVILGPDRGALEYNSAHAAEENGLWLRSYGFGSPAALPDGRVAAISWMGLTISGNAVRPQVTLRPALQLVDISPLPDGRLICTLAGQSGIGVLDIEKNEITRIYSKPPFDLHSAIFAGERPTPSLPRSAVEEQAVDDPKTTGFLLGQSVFLTRQRQVDISRVKAIRVIEGRPFAHRSARHPYDHLGVEAIELGTVPIAEDGSFYIEVPADRALSLQAVDGQGRSVVNELSWIYVRPGEQRSCTGCHSQREAAPLNSAGILALRAPPVKLLGQGAPHRWRGNNAANGGVLNLQFERMREIGSINLQSAQRSPFELQREALKHGNSDSRVSAIQHLSLLRTKLGAGDLAAALSDSAPEVRMNAALALGSCGTRESIAPLLRVLVDDEAVVAQAAHRALQTLTGLNPGFNAFTSLEERKGSAGPWMKLLEPGAMEELEKDLLERLLQEGASEVLLNALGQIGTDHAACGIRDFLRRDDERDLRVTLAGIRALGQVQCSDSVPLLAALLCKNSKLEKKVAAGDHEFGWTQRSVQVAAGAAEALGRIGTTECERILVQTLWQLGEFWRYSFNVADHDWLMGCHVSPVHFRIVEALDRMGATNTLPIIGKLIESIPIDPDRALLFETDAYETLCARVIERSGRRDGLVTACLSVLLKRPEESALVCSVTNSPPAVSVGPMCPEARAAQILSIIAKKEDSHVIREAFERFVTTKPSRTRSWSCFYLARALGKIGDATAVPLLTASLTGEKPESALGILSPPNVFVYEGMTPFHRAAVADALGKIGDRSAARTLLKVVRNLENAIDVRNAAARALVRLEGHGLQAQIREVALNYPEISTRRWLLLASEKAGNRPSKPEDLARNP